MCNLIKEVTKNKPKYIYKIVRFDGERYTSHIAHVPVLKGKQQGIKELGGDKYAFDYNMEIDKYNLCTGFKYKKDAMACNDYNQHNRRILKLKVNPKSIVYIGDILGYINHPTKYYSDVPIYAVNIIDDIEVFNTKGNKIKDETNRSNIKT